MSYCTFCGNELKDGEVCSCQLSQQMYSQTGQTQTSNGQRMQGQYYGEQQYREPQNRQPQFGERQYREPQYREPQYRKQMTNNRNDTDQITPLLKGLIHTPADAVDEYVHKATSQTVIIMSAALILLSVLNVVIQQLVHNLRWRSITVATRFGIFFKNVFLELFTSAAMLFVTALVIWLIVDKVKSNKQMLNHAQQSDNQVKVTYIQALGVTTLGQLIYVPCGLVATILGIIPLHIMTYICEWITVFGTSFSFVLLFIGLQRLMKDDNRMPLTYGLAALASGVVISIIHIIG